MVTGSLLMEKVGIRTLAQCVCVITVAGGVHKRAAPLLNVKTDGELFQRASVVLFASQ